MTSHRVSRVFSYLKKATHVFVIASYLFHGVAPAFATRTSFDEAEGRQQKVSSIEALRSIVLRERQREETIHQENKQAFDEDGYTLKIKALPQAHDNTRYQVELMLSKQDGDDVQTLDHRTFTSETFYGEQEDGSPFSSLMHRSLGFSYSLKGIGTINVCWEGTLLLHNLNFRGTALNIETTGNILARNLKGTKMNLEGNEICFEGKNTIQSLSLGFSKGHSPKSFRPDGPGSRTASVMPKATLETNDLTLKNGILQNYGYLTLNGTSRVNTLINEKKAKLFLKQGSLLTRQLQNQGKMTLDGFVTVLNDGRLQFGNPVFHVDAWQAPQHIQGSLGQGRHLSVGVLDKFKKIPETELHVYGKSFSNTSDHVFLHPLHLIVETFKNTKTLRASELSVKASTIQNDGSITGNRLTLHASQNGQNKGHLEATHHLEVTLPLIDSLGTMVSKGDLFFKTTGRDFTFDDATPWFKVGRHLCMAFLGGNLAINTHLAFPGDTRFRAQTLMLQGELDAAGDLEVQTKGDIEVQEIEHRIETTEDLLNRLKSLSCDADDHLYRTKENQAAVRDFVKHIGKDAEAYYMPILYDDVHGDLLNVQKVPASLEEAARYYPWNREIVRLFEYYLRTSKLPPLHTITLSRMKSGGDLILSGQNVNNAGGEIQGKTSLTVSAREDITHGSTYTENRFKNAYINKDYGVFTYAIPEIHGNGSLFSTPGLLTLEAGANITNNQGIMLGGTGIKSQSSGDTINKAGHILSGGKTYLSGRSFLNTQEDVVRVKTGPDNNSNPHGRWFVNDDPLPKHSGRINQPEQDYPTSGPAVVQSLGDITFDFSHVINNVAGKILAGGRITPKRALISNLPVNLVAEASLHSGNSWTKEPLSVNAGFLQATMSGVMDLSMTNIQGLVNAGMMSSQQIHVEESPFVTFEDPAASNTRALAPNKQIKTNFSLKPMLQDLQSVSFEGESEQRFNPGSHVIIGSIEGALRPILGNTTQILFALQQAFAEHYYKGYILPHLKPLEQFIQLQRNARMFALTQRERGALPSEALVVGEIDAADITLPMILYRPTLVWDKEYLVPEYWGPKELIHRFLMSPCGAFVADDLVGAKEIDDLNWNGNVYAEREIRTRSKKFSQRPQIIRQKTAHGYTDSTIGGNQETGKGGNISNHAEEHLGTEGGSSTAPDGTIKLTSNGTMKLGTAATHHKHDDGETLIEETRNHPFQMDAGDISIKALEDIILRATQAYASRTIRVKGANVFMDSVMDEYHEEKKHTQRDFFGSTTTKETNHRETHQVLNFKAGTSIDVHATKGNMDGDAPHMTAPRIKLGFPHGALLLRTVANKFFFNLETLDKNAFLNAFSVEGSSSIQHMGPQMNTDELILSEGRPMTVELTEEQQKHPNAFTDYLEQQGAKISIKHNVFQSWEETKVSVAPALRTLIALGVSIIIPGIGTGATGAMLTTGANTLGAQAVVGMINNGGNILKTLEDMTSAEALRNTAIEIRTAGLTHKLSEITEIPLHAQGDKFVDHLQSRMLHMAAQIPVEGVCSKKSFKEVFQDSLRGAAAKLVGTYGAANVGNFFFDTHPITEFEQYLAHAAVGAVAAKVKNGDIAAGALGAVIGKAVGKHLQEEMEKEGIQKGHPDYEKSLDQAVNIACFTAAAFACVLNRDADDAVFAAGNVARYGASPTFTPKTPEQKAAYVAMRRHGISEEMARAILNNPKFQSLLQEGQDFDAKVQQSEAYQNRILRDDLESSELGSLRITINPFHKTPTELALEYFKKAAVFTTEHPHLMEAAFYGLQTAIGGPVNVLRGMVQDFVIGDQRDAIRHALKTSIANYLGVTEQSNDWEKMGFEIAFASGEFGAGFLLGLGMKFVKDSAQGVVKALRRNERALQTSTIPSKKRASPTEATQIEPTVTPRAKELRTQNKTSPHGGEKIHKNSKEYAGDTHVYSIHEFPKDNSVKVGQSSRGVRKKDGASIRAESQARKLTRETGKLHVTKIRKDFPNKKDALEYETRLIKKTRSIKGKDALPGNKNNR